MSRLEHTARNFAERQVGSQLAETLGVQTIARLGGWAIRKQFEIFGPMGRIESDSPEAIARGALERGALMKEWELTMFVAAIQAHNPRNVAEIFPDNGGKTFALAHASSSEATITTVGYRSSSQRAKKRLQSYIGLDQNLHIITSDPCNVNTQLAFGNQHELRSLDLLFIDGEQADQGIKTCVERYIPFVKPGGYVAIHGISGTRLKGEQQVPEYWHELALKYPGAINTFQEEETRYGNPVWGGIGLIRTPDQ